MVHFGGIEVGYERVEELHIDNLFVWNDLRLEILNFGVKDSDGVGYRIVLIVDLFVCHL